MRKLATVRTIANVQPIEDADAIEVVTVDGWKVVTKKGEFQPGDLCIYFEIDSVLPIREEFEFLRKGCFVCKDWLKTESNPTGEGFRLRTIKLRKQISQGLVVPWNQFSREFTHLHDIDENTDLSEALGVVKWDPPIPATLAGKVKGNFPSFIPKTDQERIQNLTHELDELRTHSFEVTMKLDGSSMTAFHNDGVVGVCSRNLWLDIENDRETTFARVFYENKLDEILPKIGNIAIQGELMGPGIQGNRENLKKHELFIFDVYNIGLGRYLSPFERGLVVGSIVEWQLSLGLTDVIRQVPVVNGNIPIRGLSVEDFLEHAEGPSLTHPVREGLVYKSHDNPHKSFKVISNKFLLKGGE